MKIEMDEEHIRQRFEQVRSLRRICLSLARSSAGREVLRRCPDNESVQRTALALGAEGEGAENPPQRETP